MPYHHHCACTFLGVVYDTIEDDIDRAPDVVLCVLVGTVYVVDCLCVRLLGWAQGAVGARSEGTGVAEMVPYNLSREGIHLALLDNASVDVGY